MKKYTHYRIGLLSALLSFNTLSACVNTRKSLGFNITKQIMQWSIGGLAASSAIVPGMGQSAVPPLLSCPNRPAEVDKDIDKHIIEFVLLVDQYTRLLNDLHHIKQIQKTVDEMAKHQKDYGTDSTTTDSIIVTRLSSKSKTIRHKRA